MKNNFEISKGKKNEGFTLIEVLVTMVIFSISMLALGALQVNSMNGVTQSSRLTRASTLAHSQMELLKSVPMDDTILDAGIGVRVENSDFWTETTITDDTPFPQRSLYPDSTPPSAPVTVCKTIVINVFADDDPANTKVLASCKFIKSLTAILKSEK